MSVRLEDEARASTVVGKSKREAQIDTRRLKRLY
jgi:hypothetical protein